MTKAIEHKGTLHLFKKDVHTKEAWIVARNKGVNVNYANLWEAKRIYNCVYDEDIERVLQNMSDNCNVRQANFKSAH